MKLYIEDARRYLEVFEDTDLRLVLNQSEFAGEFVDVLAGGFSGQDQSDQVIIDIAVAVAMANMVYETVMTIDDYLNIVVDNATELDARATVA